MVRRMGHLCEGRRGELGLVSLTCESSRKTFVQPLYIYRGATMRMETIFYQGLY